MCVCCVRLCVRACVCVYACVVHALVYACACVCLHTVHVMCMNMPTTMQHVPLTRSPSPFPPGDRGDSASAGNM